MGSQRPQSHGGGKPHSATIAVTERHVRPPLALSRHVSKVSPEAVGPAFESRSGALESAGQNPSGRPVMASRHSCCRRRATPASGGLSVCRVGLRSSCCRLQLRKVALRDRAMVAQFPGAGRAPAAHDQRMRPVVGFPQLTTSPSKRVINTTAIPASKWLRGHEPVSQTGVAASRIGNGGQVALTTAPAAVSLAIDQEPRKRRGPR